MRVSRHSISKTRICRSCMKLMVTRPCNICWVCMRRQGIVYAQCHACRCTSWRIFLLDYNNPISYDLIVYTGHLCSSLFKVLQLWHTNSLVTNHLRITDQGRHGYTSGNHHVVIDFNAQCKCSCSAVLVHSSIIIYASSPHKIYIVRPMPMYNKIFNYSAS